MQSIRAVCLTVICASTAFALSQSQTTSATIAQSSGITQTGNLMRLTVTSARPLAAALDVLQNKFGWTVDYEDPQYVAKADLVDSTDARYKNSASGARPHVPSGSTFIVDFPAGDASGPDAEKTLKTLVETYNKTSNPGQFELRRQGQRFDVVGIAAHDDSGKMQKQSPPLDAIVVLSAQESLTVDAVTSVCDQVSKLTSQNLSVGVYPQNLFNRPLTIGAAEKLAARNALDKIFATALPGKEKTISWRLLYDPDSQSYVMNLHLRK